MNFVRIVLLSVLAAFCLCGIAGAQDTENGAIIDLSGSERYTEEELQAAVDIILKQDGASQPALVSLPVHYVSGGTTKDQTDAS